MKHVTQTCRIVQCMSRVHQVEAEWYINTTQSAFVRRTSLWGRVSLSSKTHKLYHINTTKSRIVRRTSRIHQVEPESELVIEIPQTSSSKPRNTHKLHHLNIKAVCGSFTHTNSIGEVPHTLRSVRCTSHIHRVETEWASHYTPTSSIV